MAHEPEIYSKTKLLKTRHEDLVEILAKQWGIAADQDAVRPDLIQQIIEQQEGYLYQQAENAELAKEQRPAPAAPGNSAREEFIPAIKRDGFVADYRTWEADRIQVKIFKGETKENQIPVKVGLNGRFYSIPRDKWVSVPKAIVRVLEDAVVTRFRQEIAQNGDITTITADVPRFAMQVRAQ